MSDNLPERLLDEAYIRSQLAEALAAKERAEAERDEALAEQKWAEEVADEYCRRLIVAEAEVARLTAALADARCALHDILDDVDRALSHPDTKPAKADEPT